MSFLILQLSMVNTLYQNDYPDQPLSQQNIAILVQYRDSIQQKITSWHPFAASRESESSTSSRAVSWVKKKLPDSSSVGQAVGNITYEHYKDDLQENAARALTSGISQPNSLVSQVTTHPIVKDVLLPGVVSTFSLALPFAGALVVNMTVSAGKAAYYYLNSSSHHKEPISFWKAIKYNKKHFTSQTGIRLDETDVIKVYQAWIKYRMANELSLTTRSCIEGVLDMFYVREAETSVHRGMDGTTFTDEQTDLIFKGIKTLKRDNPEQTHEDIINMIETIAAKSNIFADIREFKGALIEEWEIIEEESVHQVDPDAEMPPGIVRFIPEKEPDDKPIFTIIDDYLENQ